MLTTPCQCTTTARWRGRHDERQRGDRGREVRHLVALLRAIPGADVIELDAGCCGMAGSFGFEAEHYDLSMRIGELRLFPAIRAEPQSTIIAATGVSCRQQIQHGTGRHARQTGGGIGER